MQRVSFAFTVAPIFALTCAQGQDLHALQACTRLSDDAARVSCYDAAMAGSKSAPAAANLSARVREVAPLAAGRYRLTLENGQVWDTTEADSALAFHANDVVTISRGSFGSYHISLAGHNASVGVAIQH